MGLEQIGLQAILQDENFQAGLKRYQQGVGQMERSTDSAASVLTRLGSVASGALVVGIGAATAAFGAMVGVAQHGLSELQQWGEGIDKLGDQFGLTGEKASGFAFLASKVGAPVDELTFGLNALTRGLADMKNAAEGATMVTAKDADAIQNLKEKAADAQEKLNRATKALAEAKKPTDSMRYAVDDARKALVRINGDLANATKLVPKAGDKLSDFAQGLKELGVNAYNAKGKLKTFDEILPEIMDAFNKLPAGIKASDLAMKLFGARGGSKFLDFLRQGSKGLKDATRQAKLLGLELSSESSDAIEQFGFSMNELGLAIKGAWVQIGIQVLPVVQELVGLIVDNFPDITQLARSFGREIADVLTRVSHVAQSFFNMLRGNGVEDFAADMATLANKLGLDGGIIEKAVTGIATAIGNLFKAFQKGGLSGAIDQLGRELSKAFEGFDLSRSLGDIGGKVAIAIQGAWTKISPELKKWGDQFWNWLTGKGGAVEQAASQLDKVVSAITVWVKQNGPAVWGLIESWAGNFWNWITDSNSGLLVTVADNMGKLATTIENWATDPATIVQFQGIGEDLARDVLDGIGNFFTNPSPSGENVLMKLWNTLNNARVSLINTFATLGGSIAGGIVGGIVGYFLGPEAGAKVTQALTTFFTNLQKLMLSPGGPVWGFAIQMAQTMWDAFVAQWNKLFGLFGIQLPVSAKEIGNNAGLIGSTSLVNTLSSNLQSSQSTSKVGLSIDTLFRQAQNTSANGVRTSGNAAGGNFSTGSTQGITGKAGAVSSVIRSIFANGSNANQTFANAVGFGLGQAFGGGLEAALNAEVARVMAIINRILAMIRSIQNFNPASGAGSLGTNTNTASGAAMPLATRSSVSQPVTNNTTSNNRTVNVTVPISGTFNGTSESGIEAIAQHVADRTVAAILNAV